MQPYVRARAQVQRADDTATVCGRLGMLTSGNLTCGKYDACMEWMHACWKSARPVGRITSDQLTSQI
jgi:hypothetical protein